MVVQNDRMDLLTRERLPKDELFRIVKNHNQLTLEGANPLPGRGYYLKKDKDILAKARKKRVLERLCSGADCSELYDAMEASL